MKNFILITGVFEILVGLAMLIKPDAIPQYTDASELALGTARMYGAAAISMGVFATMVALNFAKTEWHQLFLRVYLIFHSLVALAVLIPVLSGKGELPIAVLHAVMAAITGFFLFRPKA